MGDPHLWQQNTRALEMFCSASVKYLWYSHPGHLTTSNLLIRSSFRFRESRTVRPFRQGRIFKKHASPYPMGRPFLTL
jgi:hypothetical protein